MLTMQEISIEQMTADYVDQTCAVQPAGLYSLFLARLLGCCSPIPWPPNFTGAVNTECPAGYPRCLSDAPIYLGSPVPDKRDVLLRLVRIFNNDSEITGGGSLTPAQVLELLCARGITFTTLRKITWPWLLRPRCNNSCLARNFTRGRLRVDLLLFIPASVSLRIPPHLTRRPNLTRSQAPHQLLIQGPFAVAVQLQSLALSTVGNRPW